MEKKNTTMAEAILSDKEIEHSKPKDKSYFLSDGGGLFLLITPSGAKQWKYKFSFNGKKETLALGGYPKVSLSNARKLRNEARIEKDEGINPVAKKRAAKSAVKEAEIAAKEAETVAKEAETAAKEVEQKKLAGQIHLVVYRWLAAICGRYDANTHKRRARAFERDILPAFSVYDKEHNIVSSKYIGDITHNELNDILKAKSQTAAETASRLLVDCNRVWLFAISENYAAFNIVSNISKKDSLVKSEKQHYPKITDEKILSELLNAIDAYHGQVITRQALRFVCYIPLRAENLCALKWEYMDFEKSLITIPRAEMKSKDKNLPDFKMPLTPQALEILKETHKLTGWGVWVFHGITDFKKHLGLETINKALRLMGFTDASIGRKQTTHSFRGTFRSLTDTYAHIHKAPFEVREAVLDHHETKGAVRAYTHKADYTAQMRPLLDWYAGFLDSLR